MQCTTVTNFCSEGKVMLLPSMARYQILLFLDSHDTDTIKRCTSMYLAISQQQDYQGFFEYGVYFF